MNGGTSENQGDSSKSLPGTPLRIAVLVSGTGSNLQALIDARTNEELPGVEIALVISNKADAQGLQRALAHKFPAAHIPWTRQSQQADAEAKILALLHLFQVELVVLAGWMRIFSREFINQFPQRIINLHPALLPNDGVGDTYITQSGTPIPVLRGLHVVRKALEAGIPVTGSTVHYVIPEVDAGPALCHAEVAILANDTEEELHQRIKEVEHQILVAAIHQYLDKKT